MNNIYFKQAIRGIKSNLSRTILTTLGIMIGIGVVILVLSSGEGFKSYINYQYQIFGTNTLMVETSVPSSTRERESGSKSANPKTSALNAVPVTTLKVRDVNDIKHLPNVKDAYGETVGQQVVTYKNNSKTSYIFGASASRFNIDKGVIGDGRGYTDQEDKSLAQVAVLGDKVASDLFGSLEPVGKFIRIGNYNFKVIGVYQPSGGIDPTNNGSEIFIPLTTLQKKLQGIDYIFYIVAELKDYKQADITALNMTDILRRNHYIKNSANDDFKVLTQQDSMKTFNTILDAITFLLIAIASISLTVGGVGIMNIMYVIVSERVNEIGLKKALGARNKDILYEFLIEAILLTLIGGIFGIIIGVLLSFVASKIIESYGIIWTFSVPVWGIIISATISMIIGIIFGVFPARNASKLNPIEALNQD